ncbi:MAG TPA: 50S ribosomal protein L1 [Candidatus Saccharimonadales bacterium]|jgi:large subunit ribosomal protein L1|nr:50S ribosomal protein L1 [Candidatus Saccharimonadales bacterium]
MAKKDVKEIIEEQEVVTTDTAVEAPVVEETKEEKAIAKAGKRSAKAIAEAEEKEAKEERKAENKEAEAEAADKPKQHANPTRPRIERQGKNFRKVAELVEKDKAYTLNEALELAVKTNPSKFDASVELHINLNVDPRHADQNIRDNLVLPAGTGKIVRIAVLDDTKVDGVDLSGVEKVLSELEKGNINFDILIATPANMPKLGKFARVLGPRGLMPNPKSGTVTTDVAKAVAEAKAGRVEYRVDTTGIVHVAVGKVSFGAKKLEENARALFASVKGNKPQSVKGTYVKAIHMATTMGPSITIDISEL